MDANASGFGLLAVQEGREPVDVDIIAIHGLDGRREKSWTKDKVNWLRDFLPNDVPHARILAYGYDAFTRGSGKLACLSLYRLGQNLAADLAAERDRSAIPKERPIIFVAHSLGGLVLKEALVDAFLKPLSDNISEIELATSGIVFLGTPHHGSPYATLHKHITDILSMIVNTNTAALKDLAPNATPTTKALEQYDSIWRRGEYDQVCFYETHKTSIGGVRNLLLVPGTSATITGVTQRAMYKDHVELVKFDSSTENDYIALRDDIVRMARDAPSKIQKRFASHIVPETKRTLSLFDIPPFQVPNFVNRPNMLGQIESRFVRAGPVSSRSIIVTLLGMGGQGKTQLAIDYCQNLQREGRVKAIFWIDATTRASVVRAMESIAKRLFPERKFDKEYDAELAVKEALRDWTDQWLMVFDGYDDVHHFSDIHVFFPQCAFGSILLTSRHRSTSMLGTIIEVDRMEREEGLRLLLGSKLSGLSDEDRLVAEQIVTLLGHLPLAVDHARAYISFRNLPLARFLSEYDARKADILRETPQLSVYRRKFSDADKETVLSVVTTWELSFSQLHSSILSSSTLKDILTLLSFYHFTSIPEELFLVKTNNETPMESFFTDGGWDHIKFESTLAKMQALSLLQLTNDTSGHILISLHPLVSEWLRLRLSSATYARCLHLAQLHFTAYLIANDADLMAFPQKQQVLNHLDSLGSFELGDLCGEDKNEFYYSAGLFYRSCAKYGPAEEMYHQALSGYEKSLGPDHISTLDTVNNLGNLYSERGCLVEAEEMYLRALAGKEMALGPDHTSTFETVNNLGNLYSDRGRLEEAEEMYLRALAGKEKALGPEHRSMLDTVNNLGNLYSVCGRLEEAEEMYLRALAGKEKALGPEHLSTLDTVNNLGNLYCNRGRLDEAEEMLTRALAGYEKASGPDHTATVMALHNLGNLYSERGCLEEAEEMFLRALAGKEMALGPDHNSTLETVNNLGNLYSERGCLEEAEEMYLRALAGKEIALGPDHTSTLDTMNNLGVLYSGRGRLEEAEEMYLRALAGYENALGPTHTSTVTVHNNLNDLLHKQGGLGRSRNPLRHIGTVGKSLLAFAKRRKSGRRQ